MNSELVFVGYGVVAPEYGWDDYKARPARQDSGDADQRSPVPTLTIRADSIRHVQGEGMTYYGAGLTI